MGGLGWQCVGGLVTLAVLPFVLAAWVLIPRRELEESSGW
jgi:hypothetical protein